MLTICTNVPSLQLEISGVREAACSTTEAMTTAYHYNQRHIHRNATGLYMNYRARPVMIDF